MLIPPLLKTTEIRPLDNLKVADVRPFDPSVTFRASTIFINTIYTKLSTFTSRKKYLDYELAFVVDKIMKKREKTKRILLINFFILPTLLGPIGHGDNAFKDYYERMVSNGITPANVKHSVARKMVSTMSAMWKTASKFDEKLL